VQKSNPTPKMLEISYSIQDEIGRVKYTLGKYQWYIDNAYKPHLPEKISALLKQGGEISDGLIKESIEEEWTEVTYSNRKKEIEDAWENESPNFLLKLKALGRPLQDKYYINLTRYGVGGSYGYPQDIQINLRTEHGKGVLWIIFHEMVHLTIEDLIRKYNIEHWTKERLVNLIINKFFPDKAGVQKDPENAEKISEIFYRDYSDIEKIIIAVSNLK
jgi:hypothetical protein